jgi:hypothetical protein
MFLRNLYTDFYSVWTNLQYHKQYVRIPFFLHLCQHLLVFFPFLNYNITIVLGVHCDIYKSS